MNFFKLLSTYLILMAFTSCKSHEKQTDSKKNDNNTEKNKVTNSNKNASQQINENSFRFIASFYSKGQGIDGNTLENYIKFLKEFEITKGSSLNYEIVNWGREGETDYCFKLSSLNTNEQEQFIIDSKNILRHSELVYTSENTLCKHKK